MNTFEAPPRTHRVGDLPPPFMPSLPASVKRTSVASVAGAGGLPVLAPAAPRTVSAAPAVHPAHQVLVAATPSEPVHSTRARRTRRAPRPRFDTDALKRRIAVFLVVMIAVSGGVWAKQKFLPSGPPHPDAWAAEVLPMVRFVEQERGLQFDHPIYVDFLTADEYAGTATPTAIDPEQVAAAQASSEVLDAFGLAVGYDTLDGDATMSSSSTLGTYSPATDRITIRGTELTPAVRVVLVHELTHALQAQHFDLPLGGDHDLVVRSIAEADAMRVERRYQAAMPPDERAAASAGKKLTTAAVAKVATVPWPVQEFRRAPYALGPALVTTVYDARGNDGVNLLFHDLPTESQLLSPWKWGPGIDATPAAVEAMAPAGATVVQPSRAMPMLHLLVMFDAWLPWSMARGALDGMQGAAYVTYRHTPDGPVCATVTATFAGGTGAFAEAVAWWAGATASAARPIVHDQSVTFEACPRGSGANVPPKPKVRPATELLVENAAIPGTVRDERAAVPHLCVVRQLIDDPAVASLLASARRTPAEQAVIMRATDAAQRHCNL